MEINDIESQHVGRKHGDSSGMDDGNKDGALTIVNGSKDGSQEGASTKMEDLHRPLINRINGMFESLAPLLTPECCIYRVPERLRKLNETAYTPRVISIGPFHRRKKETQPMEKHKERCLYNFLQRANVKLEDLVPSIRNCEERVRRCYAEAIHDLSSDAFVEMILLDGSFIIEYFLSLHEMSHENDILREMRLENDILRDLQLLENQLPFFVLEKLYNLAFSIHNPNAFIGLACQNFSYFNKKKVAPPRGLEVKHFTDLIRTFHLPSSPRILPNKEKTNDFSYSAKELHEAGVKFKVGSSKCLFDIQFTNDGLLQIPLFVIEDMTESVIRNIMALEQCKYPYETYICDYICLMDKFINTAKDVELLVQKRIICNRLGSNDALATLFNKLCLEIILTDDYFDRLCEDLTEYCETPWHLLKAILNRHYLNTPFKFASTISAIILLVLTFMQTVNSFLSL